MPAADRFVARRSRLVRKIRKTGAEALLITSFTNVTYLTGFTGDSSYLLIGPRHELLISDGRYATQIEEECPGLEASIRPPQQLMKDAVANVLERARLSKLGIESGSMTVEQYEQIRDALKAIELVSVSGAVEELRQIKDAHEIAEIREAVRSAELGFEVMRASLTESMTELQVAHELEHAMRRFGALRAGFEPIVAVGPRAALPHYRPGGVPMSAAAFVLVDWGAMGPGGYRSDLTRLIGTGKIPPKLLKLYRVVADAQRQAIEAIRPGAKCRDIDAVARKVITDAGFGDLFTHGLGHSFGLEIHESPRLSPSSNEELKAGMVMTVEPGIYVPGFGGVRIEDDVLVTRDGCEVLTSVSKDLDACAAGFARQPQR